MTEKEIKNKFIEDSKKIINFFKNDIMSLRGGRPDPGLVEFLMVEVYNQKMPLRSLASIGVSLPNQIIIQTWDENAISSIKKAIENSDLNLNPQVDGKNIILNLPPLTQERREQLKKVLSKKKEETKIHLKNARHSALKMVEAMFDNKEISEDEKFKIKDEIQEELENFNKKIDSIFEKKEKELSE